MSARPVENRYIGHYMGTHMGSCLNLQFPEREMIEVIIWYSFSHWLRYKIYASLPYMKFRVISDGYSQTTQTNPYENPCNSLCREFEQGEAPCALRARRKEIWQNEVKIKLLCIFFVQNSKRKFIQILFLKTECSLSWYDVI